MGQPGDIAHPRVLGDPIGAEQQLAGLHFQPEPVGKGTQQRCLRPLRQVIGNGQRRALEGPGERALEPALGDRLLQLCARNPDPGPPSRRAGQGIGQDQTVRRDRQAQQIVAGTMIPGQDAAPFGLRRGVGA